MIPFLRLSYIRWMEVLGGSLSSHSCFNTYIEFIHLRSTFFGSRYSLYSILPETPNNSTRRSNMGVIIANSWGFRWWNVDKYYAAGGSRCSRFGFEADVKLRGS